MHYENFNYSKISDKNGDFISINRYYANEESVVIPSSIDGFPVCRIGSNAFASSNIKKVSIPEGVTCIGSQAFRFCRFLRDVSLPNSLIEIDDDAFEASSIKNISFGRNLKIIGDYAFHACQYLESVVLPDSLESVGEGAFDDCNSLELLHIGESVDCFDSDAYILSNCPSLKHLTVSPKNSNFFAVDGMLMHRDGYLLRCAPETQKRLLTIPKGINNIVDGAFEDLDNTHILKVLNNELLLDSSFLEDAYDLIIKCDPHSKAAKWARVNGVEVHPLRSELASFLFSNSDTTAPNFSSPFNENDEIEL